MCNTPTPLQYAQFYLDTWNETNASRRALLLDQAWTPEAVYIDPLMQAQGRSQIDGLIRATQARFPGWRFVLLGEPDQHGDHLRFSWSLGPQGGDTSDGPIKGTDYALVKERRFARVTGFLDQLPEA